MQMQSFILGLIGLFFCSCGEGNNIFEEEKIETISEQINNVAETEIAERKKDYNKNLANEPEGLAKVEQIVAYIPQGIYAEMSKVEWNSSKDSVYVKN